MSGKLDEFLWIVVLGGICGFGYGFLIGANDVANAFASSVSSKSITLKQAVIIASIFEFSGAFFLGASVTGTIRGKIVSTDLYTDEPEVLLFGMFTSLFSAIIILFAATHFGLPVSTTHDIVACIMGFTIAAKGFDSVNWEVARKIFMSWVASPLLSGAVGAFLFANVKYLVMKSKNPFQRAFWTFPIVLTIGIGIDLFYVLYKGTSNMKAFQGDLKLSWVLPVSFGTGAFAGFIWLLALGPIVKRRIEAQNSARIAAITDSEKGNPESNTAEDIEEPSEAQNTVSVPSVKDSNGEESEEPSAEDKAVRGGVLGAWDRLAAATFSQDLHGQALTESKRAAEIWEEGEKFDDKAEDLFTYVQVFTACLNSFAHGANDVSNTIAPLSAIIQIYREGSVSGKSEVQEWVLAFGGAAIVIGLLLYGYKVIKSIGYKLTLLSPSRGASAELAASLIVVTASFNELPVSSTQCIVGAVSGVGLVGGLKNVQWLFLLRVCVGWVVMFFVAALLSAGVFSFGAFAPSLV